MKNILTYLEHSAIAHKDKIAIIEGDNEVSYYDLLCLSKKLGSYLISKYNITDKPIVLFMDKGISCLIGMFGTVYSGNFYAVANADLPEDRLKKQDSVLNSSVVLTKKLLYERAVMIYGEEKVEIIDDILEGDTPISEEKLSAVRDKFVDVAPLYANFTSGSTGVPKAVLVSHRSVLDFIDYFVDIFNINENDILANQAPFDFDVSVKDIYSTIKAGATLVIVPKEYFAAPAKLLDLLCDKGITTMVWAVSALCLITTFHGLDYKVPETVNKILFSGESMPLKHLNTWMQHLPNATYVNLYGPTEITCNCTYHIIDKNRGYDKVIPIGKPFPNEEIILLNEQNQKVTEAFESGEICVRGTALALGYYNCMEQTEKAFCQNPLNTTYPDIIYRTGDLGYYGEDGELYFNGRKDFQVKYMGHRIELEEIELAINEIEGVARCIVVFQEEKSKLYGFYKGDIDKKELHAKLRERLPVFMVPGALRQVEDFPLTKNGKVDRKALLELKKR